MVLAAHFLRFSRLPDSVPVSSESDIAREGHIQREKMPVDSSAAEEDDPDRANAAFAEIGLSIKSGLLQLLIHHVIPMQVNRASSSQGKSLSVPWIARSDPIVHTGHVVHQRVLFSGQEPSGHARSLAARSRAPEEWRQRGCNCWWLDFSGFGSGLSRTCAEHVVEAHSPLQ